RESPPKKLGDPIAIRSMADAVFQEITQDPKAERQIVFPQRTIVSTVPVRFPQAYAGGGQAGLVRPSFLVTAAYRAGSSNSHETFRSSIGYQALNPDKMGDNWILVGSAEPFALRILPHVDAAT